MTTTSNSASDGNETNENTEVMTLVEVAEALRISDSELCDWLDRSRTRYKTSKDKGRSRAVALEDSQLDLLTSVVTEMDFQHRMAQGRIEDERASGYNTYWELLQEVVKAGVSHNRYPSWSSFRNFRESLTPLYEEAERLGLDSGHQQRLMLGMVNLFTEHFS